MTVNVSFDIKCKLLTGRRLFNCVGSKPGFLRIGVTRVSFYPSEKWPHNSESFITREITGNSTSRQPTRRKVGIGSNGQDFLADLRMSAETSFSESGWKEWKACASSTSWSGGSALRTLGSMSTASISERILSFLRRKKPPMSSASFDLSW